MIGIRSVNEVKRILENYGLHPLSIELGQVEIQEQLSFNAYNEIRKTLVENEFDLVLDKQVILIEKINAVIIEMIYFSEEQPSIKYSAYLSERLKMNYTYISKFFSNVKKITIEKFIISQKIERVKQMLIFNDLTLSEIAWKLNYSSPAHLSAQFKKITGLTPSLFKKNMFKKITPPDNP